MTQSFAHELLKEAHIPTSWTEQQFKDLQMDLESIALIQSPFENSSWPKYRSIMIKEPRIQRGKIFLTKARKTFQHYETLYHIPKEIVASIIGVETNYGSHQGQHSALEALATLAFYYSPRADFFRQETKELLRIAYLNHWNLAQIKSSYAGAMGIAQFMPSAIHHYAIGHKTKLSYNLFENNEDAIASVFNYLHKKGKWKPHQKLIEPTHITPTQQHYLATHKLNHLDFIPAKSLPYEIFPGIGSKGPKFKPPKRNVSIGLRRTLTPENTHQYYILYENFNSILAYNKSGHYAHAIYELAKQLTPPSVDAKKSKKPFPLHKKPTQHERKPA